MARTNNLAVILSGGAGRRLYPLTKNRAKPAVRFAANFMLIDFVLSNMYHSGIRKIYIVTQHESHSLHKHIKYGWYPRFGNGRDEFLTVLPAIRGEEGGWHEGTADAITKNLNYIKSEDVEIVNIFASDHIYFMDISQFNDFHIKNRADLTICAVPVKIEEAANNYGVLEVDNGFELKGFEEKPSNPKPMPNNKDYCFSSMGNYAFNPEVLFEEIRLDAKKEYTNDKELIKDNPDKFSSYDFGFDIIPSMLRRNRKIFVYNFQENEILGSFTNEKGFWRDIGDIDKFYKTNMEIRSINPPINLYNPKWEVLTYTEYLQPAKFVNNGKALESIIANNVIISRSDVINSVIGGDVKVESSKIDDSIILGKVRVGDGCYIKRTIIDENVSIPYGTIVGVNKEEDEKRGFTISKDGITVVPKDYKF